LGRHDQQPDNLDPELADEALMQRFRGGEAAAFRVLVKRHQDRVFDFVLRQVRSPETAQELVQETFLRVVKNADTFRRLDSQGSAPTTPPPRTSAMANSG